MDMAPAIRGINSSNKCQASLMFYLFESLIYNNWMGGF
jgi:hypothetical protein